MSTRPYACRPAGRCFFSSPHAKLKIFYVDICTLSQFKTPIRWHRQRHFTSLSFRQWVKFKSQFQTFTRTFIFRRIHERVRRNSASLLANTWPHNFAMLVTWSIVRSGHIQSQCLNSIFCPKNHGSHSVLIHPQTGNDPIDHSTHALWLGAQLKLDFSKLH